MRYFDPWVTDEKITLTGHLGGIPGIAVNREGTLLASAGKDRTVRIWDSASGRPVKTLTDFSGPAQAVAFAPDGRRLVTAEFQGDLRIWDIATAKPGRSRLRAWVGRSGRSSSHRTAAPSGAGSPQAAVWRVEMERKCAKHRSGVRRSPANIYGGCLSPDGQRLASSTSGRLEVFDVAEKRSIFSVPYSYPGEAPGTWRSSPMGSDSSASIAATRSRSGILLKARGHDFRRRSDPNLQLDDRAEPDGNWLAEANRGVTIWDVEHATRPPTLPETRNGIWSLAWIPRQNRLAAGTSDGELVIWDLDRVRASLVELGLDRNRPDPGDSK